MNKTHRIVWSESRGAFIVAHEFAATSGKRSSTTKNVIAQSLAVAALLATAGPAHAQVTGTYVVPAGGSFNNTNTIVGTTHTAGIYVNVSAGSVTNSGTITQSPGIEYMGVFLDAGTLTGGITNTGLINVQANGIYLANGSTASAILNSGTIAGLATTFNYAYSGITVNGGRLGLVTNAGSLSVISGGTFGIIINSGASVTGLVNAGSISAFATAVAIKGASSTIGSITNTGVIDGMNDEGILVQDASLGTISNSASIVGSQYGVELSSTIQGATNTISSIVNSGLISGYSGGVQVFSGGRIGTISNASSGVIGSLSGNGVGINIGTGAMVGLVTNAGTIGASNSFGTGISLQGSLATLTNSGAITGDYALKVSGGSLTSLMNSGQLDGSQTGIALTNNGTIGSIVNSGTITGAGMNLGGGGNGIYLGSASLGGITNSGLVRGASDGIKLQSGVISGSIQNSGVISGSDTGILVSGASTIAGSISNSGTISGGSSHGGIKILGGSVASISNSGVIKGGSGNAFGVDISFGTLGTLINSGSITGSDVGLTVGSGSTISGGITNSGVITGGYTGIGIYGATVVGAIVNQPDAVIGSPAGAALTIQFGTVGSVLNAGTMSGGIDLFYGTIVGALQNSAFIGGVGATGYGVEGQGSTIGSFVNSGTITGQFGGVLLSNSTIAGGITNSGKISGEGGIFLAGGSYGGGLVNSGTISSSGYVGAELAFLTLTGGIHNLAGGLISGESGLVTFFTTLDSITNDAGGKIVGLGPVQSGSSETPPFSGVGLIANSTLTGSIVNNGLISGYSNGITIASGSSVMGGIVNTGTISGNVAGIYLGDLSSNYGSSVINGGITNSGHILGGAYGIEVAGVDGATFSGGITNSGMISGTSVAGIYATSAKLSGGIANSAGGIITGADGIDLVASTVEGGVTNAGTIAGSKYSINVDAASSLGTITIAGANSAAFMGDVYSPNSAVSLTSGSTFTGTNAFNVASFDVAAGATLNMGVMASTAGEANGITVSNGVTNEGTLSVGRNTANINGSYTQAASAAFGVGVASKTSHGVLAISGAANLSPVDNIVVNVAGNNSLSNKETIAGVLTSTDLTASTFKVTDNSDLISFTGFIDGNNVDLVTKFNALVLPDTIANHNTNAVGAATVLDQIILASNGSGPFTGVINDIAKLQTSREVSNAASQTLPLLSGDVTVATYAALSQMNQVVQSRVEGNYGMSAGSPYMQDQNAWVKPFGSWANAADQNGAPGFSSGVEGVALGGDAAISNAARVGLAFAYANVDVSGNSHDAPNDDRINMYQLMGYGSYAIDPRTEVNAQVDGGINSNDGHRSITFAGTNATSSFNSSDAHVGIGIARALPLSDTTIFTPQVRVDYTWISTDDYSEGGAGPLSLNTKSTSFESLLTQINGKLTQKLNDNLTLFGNLGIGYDSLAHTNTSVVAAFSGAPGLSFSTQGIGLSPRALLGGIGITSTPRGNMPELSFRYDVQQRDGFADQSVSFKARWAF